jgi:hypothetical protein
MKKTKISDQRRTPRGGVRAGGPSDARLREDCQRNTLHERHRTKEA